ncbi:MAG: HutD family protein [Bacteroidales bacterium]|nr:HutD family protein [Bacteroidales bacterium]
MKAQILTSNDFKTSAWSGGTTTQLYIYPPYAEYQLRNFDFRLSSARVETEKSEFTTLPGVARKLMILDGEIVIHHQNHYSKKLGKFDVESFEGEWKTTSVGTCTDFNLMTTGATYGEISSLILAANQQSTVQMTTINKWLFVFLLSGEIRIDSNHKSWMLKQGNLISIQNDCNSTINVTGLKHSELVLVSIQLKG